MKETKYSINMHTPLGIRQGKLLAVTRQNQISGTIEILEHTEPFEGSIEADGTCKIKGCLTSLMKKLEYVALGKVTPTAIKLMMHSENSSFKISGDALPEEGEAHE